jgi:excisionase family DNA binding protein
MTDERAARYLSAPEAARYLGVSRRTFYEYVRPKVQFARIGARVVFDTNDLDAWIASRKEAPPERVEAPQRHQITLPVRRVPRGYLKKKQKEQGSQ